LQDEHGNPMVLETERHEEMGIGMGDNDTSEEEEV